MILSCPSFWKPVEITAGSREREVWDGSVDWRGVKFALLARVRIVFPLSVVQPIVVREEPILGEARHLRNRQDYHARAVRTNEKDIH